MSPIPHADAKAEEVGRLPNGATLYREPNEVGGHRYWSDEIGGGVCVWDTSLVTDATLLAAIVEEHRRIYAEYMERRRSRDPKPADSMTPQPPPPKLTRVRWIEEEDLIIKGPEA